MKALYFFFICFITLSCATNNSNSENYKQDDDEWEVTVFDVGYENFLVSRARPMSFYTESNLHIKNSFLVPQWNARVNQVGFNRNVYENRIEYSTHEKYGLEFEYRLYQAFVYVAWKYGETFNGLATENL